MTNDIVLKPADDIKVSVIIPVYNRDELLTICLESIKQSNYSNYEVIVVDDGSQTPFSKCIQNSNFIYLRHEKNKGAGAARNTGAAKAVGEILLFIDSDIEIYPNTISNIANEFKLDKRISALTAMIAKENRFKNFFSLYKTAFFRWSVSNMGSEVAYICTSCAAIRKSMFQQIGGFSEKYKGASWEDVEIGLEIIKNQGVIRFTNKIEVIHNKKLNIKTIIKSDYSRTVDLIKLLTSNRKQINKFKARGLYIANVDNRAAVALIMVCAAFTLIAIQLLSYLLGYQFLTLNILGWLLLCLLAAFLYGSSKFLKICFEVAGSVFMMKVTIVSIFMNLIYGIAAVNGLLYWLNGGNHK
jgi:glycosyltransferase involved in cell wall biosynthesis